ncbi:uncharacterized protein LOC142590838 [Dermacentor variabilis]|uniref:uncharacterized protein LOC142590838 n=1 Tax=Dermacentor variabilis TaxID=34621 RepID=UPI003F5B1867
MDEDYRDVAGGTRDHGPAAATQGLKSNTPATTTSQTHYAAEVWRAQLRHQRTRGGAGRNAARGNPRGGPGNPCQRTRDKPTNPNAGCENFGGRNARPVEHCRHHLRWPHPPQASSLLWGRNVVLSLQTKETDLLHLLSAGTPVRRLPDPGVKTCRQYGQKDPEEHHQCTPKCLLCGEPHAAGTKDCKQRLKTTSELRWGPQGQQRRGRSRSRGGARRPRWFRNEDQEKRGDYRSESRSRSRGRSGSRDQDRSRERDESYPPLGGQQAWTKPKQLQKKSGVVKVVSPVAARVALAHGHPDAFLPEGVVVAARIVCRQDLAQEVEMLNKTKGICPLANGDRRQR